MQRLPSAQVMDPGSWDEFCMGSLLSRDPAFPSPSAYYSTDLCALVLCPKIKNYLKKKRPYTFSSSLGWPHAINGFAEDCSPLPWDVPSVSPLLCHFHFIYCCNKAGQTTPFSQKGFFFSGVLYWLYNNICMSLWGEKAWFTFSSQWSCLNTPGQSREGSSWNGAKHGRLSLSPAYGASVWAWGTSFGSPFHLTPGIYFLLFGAG